MKSILITLGIFISFTSLYTKIDSDKKKKFNKTKLSDKDCAKFKKGKFKVILSKYGEIIIIRNENTQIEYRTNEYYTKEKIVWIGDCKFKKIYTEINDPIFSKEQADALKESEFIEEIIEIKDDKHFFAIEYRDGQRSIPILNQKIE